MSTRSRRGSTGSSASSADGHLGQRRGDREIGLVDTTELARIRMGVDERLLRVRRLEERVAARGHLTESAADREHEIGVAQPPGDRLVHRDAENADVTRRAVVDEVLAPKRARHRKLVRLAERLHVAARLGGPATLADDDEGPLGGGEQLAQPVEVLRCRSDTLRLERGASAASDSSASTSSGSARTTGPGRPESATENASAMCSGTRAALSISHAAFAMPPKTCA